MLRSSEIKPLIVELETFKNELEFDDGKTRMEVVEINEQQLFLFNGSPFLFRFEDRLIPTLFFKNFILSAPKIAVDRGAIPHICNGADVMSPGVRNLTGSFSEGEIVVIVDETHGKPLAIGKALLNLDAMRKIQRGPVVKTLHYVGDRIYNVSKAL